MLNKLKWLWYYQQNSSINGNVFILGFIPSVILRSPKKDLNSYVNSTKGSDNYKEVNPDQHFKFPDKDIKKSSGEYDPYATTSDRDSTKNNPSLPSSDTKSSLATSTTFNSLPDEVKKKMNENTATDIAEYQKPIFHTSEISQSTEEYDPYKEGGEYDKKKVKVKESTIDFVLEKESTEMPSLFEDPEG